MAYAKSVHQDSDVLFDFDFPDNDDGEISEEDIKFSLIINGFQKMALYETKSVSIIHMLETLKLTLFYN